jgi:peptidoglycan/xylan/chitin deacetylase (PgdA/CDA1 family)
MTVAGKNHWTAFESLENEPVFVPIIMYHSIIENKNRTGDYAVTPETVESDMKYLKENGYTSIFVEDIVNYVCWNKPLPVKPVVITLDDGFYNNSYYLLPLLEKYDMKATISVVGYFSEFISVKDPHVPEYSYLTWNDMIELHESGRIEFGNHTYNMHSNNYRQGCAKLSYETEEEYAEAFRSDIGLLQSLMKINTGIIPSVFAYPYGYISKESVPLLKEMGFTAALSCYEKPNYITHDEKCLYELNRYNRSENISTEEFMKKLLSY